MVGHFKCQHMRAGETKETPLRRLKRRLLVFSVGNVMIRLLILGRPAQEPNKNNRIGIENKSRLYFCREGALLMTIARIRTHRRCIVSIDSLPETLQYLVLQSILWSIDHQFPLQFEWLERWSHWEGKTHSLWWQFHNGLFADSIRFGTTVNAFLLLGATHWAPLFGVSRTTKVPVKTVSFLSFRVAMKRLILGYSSLNVLEFTRQWPRNDKNFFYC